MSGLNPLTGSTDPRKISSVLQQAQISDLGLGLLILNKSVHEPIKCP